MGQQVLVLWDLGQYLVVEQSVLAGSVCDGQLPPSPLPRSPPRLFAELRALKRGERELVCARCPILLVLTPSRFLKAINRNKPPEITRPAPLPSRERSRERTAGLCFSWALRAIAPLSPRGRGAGGEGEPFATTYPRGSSLKHTELMQYRNPVGGGPSGKT